MIAVDIEDGPRILAVRDRYVVGGKAEGCEAVTVADAMTREFATDVHLAMYEPPTTPPMRLRLDLMPVVPSPNACAPLAPTLPLRIVLLIVDVDGPQHGRTPAWDESFRARAAHLPGEPFVPWTRGGARIVYTREYVVTDPDEYTAEVLLDLVAIAAVSGIVCDPSCTDVTRITRAPHATRDGVLQAHGWVRGHAAAPGRWTRPEMSDAEVLATLGWLAMQSPAWAAKARRLLPPPPPPKFARRDPMTAATVASCSLMRTCDELRSAPSGTRHVLLARKAYALGGLAAGGRLDPERALAELHEAVRHYDDPRKTQRTLEGQFEAGMRSPL